MQKGLVKRLLPHFIAVGIFLVVALIYCRPVLQGDVLQQHDITQWKAMAKNSFDYKETHGHFPLWTNSMFSGMPAYQIAMEATNNISPALLYKLFTLGLPKPMNFFFLACICFYFLTQVLRINPWIGIIGSLAYAYATYNPIIIAAGHDTKMQSIALLPALIASIIMVYERKYLWGAALTALFSALLIGMNHAQIAYYALMIAGFMTLGYMFWWIRNREVKHLFISIGIVVIAGVIGVMANAVSIFTTYEYSKATIRGGSELADSASNYTKTGLSKEYAFDYSMYKMEPFVMMVPKMFGGSDLLEKPEEESKAIEQLRQMPQQLAQQAQYGLHFYWGGIGGTSGPPYAGAIICLLALIGFFILDNKHKWWILAAMVISIMMSWGSFFEGFNSFLLKVLPLYNKFRAPSMILVIPTFLLCLMAVMTLQKIITTDKRDELWANYKKGLMLTGGLLLLVILYYFSADYTSENDQRLLAQFSDQGREYIQQFLNSLKEDRRSLFAGSLLRSILFMGGAALVLWMAIKRKMQTWMVFSILGVLAFIDVMGIDSKYLNKENYQEENEYNQSNFAPTQSEQQIQQDKSYFRVLDLRQGLGVALGSGGARIAYFANSIGGYHPAKLSIYQDLIEHQLYHFPQCLPVINMLNTKYIIQADQSGKENLLTNPDALGPVWFVKGVRFEATPLAVMNGLTTLNTRDTAIVYSADQKLVSYDPGADSAATIQLVKNDNDDITYQSQSASNRFAVFSEVYYNKGWKAFIDDKEAPIVRTNYVLRGLSIPAGQHKIHFVFHPDSYYKGNSVALVCSILIFLLLIAAIASFRKRLPAEPVPPGKKLKA